MGRLHVVGALPAWKANHLRMSSLRLKNEVSVENPLFDFMKQCYLSAVCLQDCGEPNQSEWLVPALYGQTNVTVRLRPSGKLITNALGNWHALFVRGGLRGPFFGWSWYLEHGESPLMTQSRHGIGWKKMRTGNQPPNTILP
jgi:hypothetical protein